VNELGMQRAKARNDQDHNPRTTLNEILADMIGPRYMRPLLEKRPIKRLMKYISTQPRNILDGVLIYFSE
jgi:hypothetical protein